MVFLTMLVKKFLPPTSLAFPLIAKYLVFTFIMNLTSMATSVCVINVNHRETRHMPNSLKWAFLVALPWLLLMDRPRKHRYHTKKGGTSYKEFLVTILYFCEDNPKSSIRICYFYANPSQFLIYLVFFFCRSQVTMF